MDGKRLVDILDELQQAGHLNKDIRYGIIQEIALGFPWPEKYEAIIHTVSVANEAFGVSLREQLFQILAGQAENDNQVIEILSTWRKGFSFPTAENCFFNTEIPLLKLSPNLSEMIESILSFEDDQKRVKAFFKDFDG